MTPSPHQKAFLLGDASTTSTKVSSSLGQAIVSRCLSSSLRVCQWSCVQVEDKAVSPTVVLCEERCWLLFPAWAALAQM